MESRTLGYRATRLTKGLHLEALILHETVLAQVNTSHLNDDG